MPSTGHHTDADAAPPSPDNNGEYGGGSGLSAQISALCQDNDEGGLPNSPGKRTIASQFGCGDDYVGAVDAAVGDDGFEDNAAAPAAAQRDEDTGAPGRVPPTKREDVSAAINYAAEKNGAPPRAPGAHRVLETHVMVEAAEEDEATNKNQPAINGAGRTSRTENDATKAPEIIDSDDDEAPPPFWHMSDFSQDEENAAAKRKTRMDRVTTADEDEGPPTSGRQFASQFQAEDAAMQGAAKSRPRQRATVPGSRMENGSDSNSEKEPARKSAPFAESDRQTVTTSFTPAANRWLRQQEKRQQQQQQQQRATVIVSSVIRPPPPSMMRGDTESEREIQMYSVQATLVDSNNFSYSVYNAIPLPAEEPTPWWKKYRAHICGGTGLLIGLVVAVAVGVSLSKNGNGDAVKSVGNVVVDEVKPGDETLTTDPSSPPTLGPSQSSRPSFRPSLRPSSPPSKSFLPTNSRSPTSRPSTSTAPTTYWSSLRWEQLGQDINGNAPGVRMGSSVALSADGMTLAIGSPGKEDDDDIPGHVTVYCMERDGDGNWTQLGMALEGNEIGDEFGAAVSLSASGDTLAVGAPGIAGRPGYVKIYSLENDGRWEPFGQTILGEAVNDWFGKSVALSADGRAVVAGAPLNNGEGGLDSGHARVYHLDNRSISEEHPGHGIFNRQPKWELLGDLDGKRGKDNLGNAVATSADGRVLALGVMNADVPAPGGGELDDAGQVAVFLWNETLLRYRRRGDYLNGTLADDEFGYSVALSADGNMLAVGANQQDADGYGLAFVYSWDDHRSEYVQLGPAMKGDREEDHLGWSVALSSDGRTLAVGAPGDERNGHRMGYVKIYVQDGDRVGFTQLGQTLMSLAPGDEVGKSVALSADGKTVATGGPGVDDSVKDSINGKGQVKVFRIKY